MRESAEAALRRLPASEQSPALLLFQETSKHLVLNAG
jgi:hypothetical protein